MFFGIKGGGGLIRVNSDSLQRSKSWPWVIKEPTNQPDLNNRWIEDPDLIEYDRNIYITPVRWCLHGRDLCVQLMLNWTETWKIWTSKQQLRLNFGFLKLFVRHLTWCIILTKEFTIQKSYGWLKRGQYVKTKFIVDNSRFCCVTENLTLWIFCHVKSHLHQLGIQYSQKQPLPCFIRQMYAETRSHQTVKVSGIRGRKTLKAAVSTIRSRHSILWPVSRALNRIEYGSYGIE